jgi:hypothetical protein
MPRRQKRTTTLNKFGYDGDVYETVSTAASQANAAVREPGP